MLRPSNDIQQGVLILSTVEKPSLTLTRRRALAAVASAALPCTGAWAQGGFPSKTITIVVPYPPGSASDLLARMLQPRLADAFKQAVIIENKGGASTNIGTEYVSRAAPDGHTILFQAPNIATNEFAFGGLHWKREDFAPVALMVRWSNVLVAGPSAPTRDLRQLVAVSKSSDGLNYGTPGVGSLSHLAVEMLKARTGLRMEHITFTGTAPMITALVGGHIQYGVTNPASFMSQVKDGKLAPMVVLSTQRDATTPDVPTLADFGITGIESNGWLGALVPARTPASVISTINTELLKALRAPEIVAKLRDNYLEVTGSTPAEFAHFMVTENAKWGEAFKTAGIKPQ
ncbi:Argininosuccinate lyase [Variovorax sp. SRS16]|nr:Argininosuccinate lyase [Variovorax sp. SRS16]